MFNRVLTFSFYFKQVFVSCKIMVCRKRQLKKQSKPISWNGRIKYQFRLITTINFPIEKANKNKRTKFAMSSQQKKSYITEKVNKRQSKETQNNYYPSFTLKA